MAARALEFLILTAARSGEVRLATWDEVCLDSKVWTIPADRKNCEITKTKKPAFAAGFYLVVPLTIGSWNHERLPQ